MIMCLTVLLMCYSLKKSKSKEQLDDNEEEQVINSVGAVRKNERLMKDKWEEWEVIYKRKWQRGEKVFEQMCPNL